MSCRRLGVGSEGRFGVWLGGVIGGWGGFGGDARGGVLDCFPPRGYPRG